MHAEPLFAFTFQCLHYLQHTGPVNLDYSADPSMLFQVLLHMERDVALVHWAVPRNCLVEGLYSPPDLHSKHARYKDITVQNDKWCHCDYSIKLGSVVEYVMLCYVISLQKEEDNLQAHLITETAHLVKSAPNYML